MACMEDQAIGQHLTVFLEREIDFEVLGESSWGILALQAVFKMITEERYCVLMQFDNQKAGA